MIFHKYLINNFSYNPSTGNFTRLLNGKVAGCIDAKGYVVFSVLNKVQKAHRLAWLYMTGEMPKGQIDHINGDKSDNRFINLRVVNNSQNQMNKPIQINNSSGFKGVNWFVKRGKWRSYITINSVQKHLGLFNTLEEALRTRINAEIYYFGIYSNNKAVIAMLKASK